MVHCVEIIIKWGQNAKTTETTRTTGTLVQVVMLLKYASPWLWSCHTVLSVSCVVYADECTELENVCPANLRCVNTIGSYECRPACRPRRRRPRRTSPGLTTTTPTTAPTTTVLVPVQRKFCSMCPG